MPRLRYMKASWVDHAESNLPLAMMGYRYSVMVDDRDGTFSVYEIVTKQDPDMPWKDVARTVNHAAWIGMVCDPKKILPDVMQIVNSIPAHINYLDLRSEWIRRRAGSTRHTATRLMCQG